VAPLLPLSSGLRKLLLATLFAVLVCSVLLVTAVFAGPFSSGALFLLLPAHATDPDGGLPESYEPLHKGSVDLGTGLYIRENEDLVVAGSPALILRRTYLSGYRVSTQFGIGTTHTGEQYLHGDGHRFQWASLILARGTSVNFRRVSRGTSFYTAMYEHRETSSEWEGARLGWAGSNWALRKRDGSLAIFQGCGPGLPPCSIIRSRDAAGGMIYYRRNRAGRLVKMDDGKDRWIAFDYDDRNRIARAHDSNHREVRYDYDDRGRLSRVAGSDGKMRRYTYTDADELATIEEPGASIENVYENGRCVRQVNKYNHREPYTFDFTYTLADGKIARTDTKESDGTWSQYTWGDGRTPSSETRGRTGYQPAIFTYDRDPATKAVTALTLTCPDRTGRPLRHSSLVGPDNEEWIKWDLLRTHCSWTSRRSRTE
jgi:YD repeat-containing protein